jgi:hypothetical protein
LEVGFKFLCKKKKKKGEGEKQNNEEKKQKRIKERVLGKSLHKTSNLVSFFLAAIFSYFSCFVVAGRPCHGSSPFEKVHKQVAQ